MKGLSLTQPFATLVAIGQKRIETRSWKAPYRGYVAIHAAKGFPRDAILLCRDEPFRTVLKTVIKTPNDLPRGAIVAVAILDDVMPIVGRPLPSGKPCVSLDEFDIARVWRPSMLGGERLHVGDISREHEAAFGDYTPGRFGWLLKDVRPLREPVPCRGALGLWDVPPEVFTQIEAQLPVGVL